MLFVYVVLNLNSSRIFHFYLLVLLQKKNDFIIGDV